MPLSDDERGRVAALRLLIVWGGIAPGESRRYADLTEALGTDAKGVAAAVRELGRDGFLELLDGEGFRVTEEDPDDVDDVVAIRLLVEPAAVRQAAAAVRAADLITLREMAEGLERAEKDFDRFFEADEGLVATMLTLLPNRKLAELVVDLRLRTRLDGARQIVEAGLYDGSRDGYGPLIESIEAHDPDGVERFVRRRLRQLRYLGAPRRERGESWPFREDFPPDDLPFDVDEYADTGW